MDAEITAVEAEIIAHVLEKPIAADDPKVIKLRDLKRLRGQYRTPLPLISPQAVPMSGTVIGTVEISDTNVFGEIIRHVRVGRKPSPQRQRALAVARDVLHGKTEPVKTSDIYKEMQKKGIAIGGSIPVNNLSAMLHHADGFRSHGRAGWTYEAMQ